MSEPTRPIVTRPSAPDATPTVDSLARLRAPSLELERERYATGTLLGRGGMGEVHQATDRALRRDVALKTLRAAGDAEAEVRFVREARITARLDHPNVVPVYDLGRDADGGLFYTMKQVEGRSLAALGTEDVSDVRRLQIFVQVCDAIAYAHSRGVVHRDLKPANVMVGDFGEVIVLDWGLAKRLGDGEAEPLAGAVAPPTDDTTLRPGDEGVELTQANTILGTPSWMAPEQVRGEPYTPAADQYALGAILYFLLAREPAFRSTGDVMANVVTSNFRRPRVVRPEVPLELEAVILRAMEANPADRYADVAGLRDDVQAWLEGHEVRAMRYTRWMRLKKAARRQRGPLLAAASVAGAALLLTIAGAAAGTWAYVTSLREEKARTAAAEREARVQVADGQVTLALMHADLDQESTARGELADALERYRRADAIGPDVPHAERTDGLPLRAWFAQAWLEHRHPTPLLQWDAESDPVDEVLAHPDEGSLLFVGRSGTVHHLDARDGRTLGSGRIPQGARWLGGGWDDAGTVRMVWAEAEGEAWRVRIAALGATEPALSLGDPQADPPRAVALRGATLLVDMRDGIHVYDARTGAERGTRITDAWLDGVSADGRVFAGRTRESGSALRAAVNHGVWDVTTGARLYFQPRGAEVALDPSGATLLAMSANGVELVDLLGAAGPRTRWAVAAEADAGWVRGDAIYTLTGDVLTAHDPATGVATGTWEAPIETTVVGHALLPLRRTLVSPGPRPALVPIDAPAATDLARERAPAIRLDLSPDGVLIVTAGGLTDGTVRVRDALTGKPVSSFRSNPVSPGALTRQGQWVTSSTLAGTRDVAFSPNGARIAAADRDGHVRVWTLDGQPVADHLPSPPLGITLGVDWTSSGLVAVFERGDLIVYDPSGERPARTARGTIASAGGLAVSPDGRWCVVTGRGVSDPQWELWDVARGVAVRRSPRTEKGAIGIAWAPGSERFAVTSQTGGVEVLDLHGTSLSRTERPGLTLTAAFLSNEMLAFAQNSVLHLIEAERNDPFGAMVRPPDEGVWDVEAHRDALYVLRDGGRLARVDLRPTRTLTLPLSNDGVAPHTMARATARWGRWEEAAAWLRAAHDAGTSEQVPVVERAALLRAAGAIGEANGLSDALRAAGVEPATIDAWLGGLSGP